jgi:succinoglycan biosynthesis protein ExoA
MEISVLIPIYQEIKYIESIYEFVTKACPVEKEIYFIDGGSTDGTVEFLNEKLMDNIYLIHNENKTVPYGLNKAIPLCKTKYIIRLDAHTNYNADYFTQVLKTFDETGADIVGGPMRIAAGNDKQIAIGKVTSTSFGIGNSRFHFEDYKGYTDSVYLGAWKSEIFEKIGLFDTYFKRNQDDEFHYRAIKFGLKIFQDPEIKLFYFPRDSFEKLFVQYFQYGLFKPAVLRKNSIGFSVRHVVPTLFVGYLLLLSFNSCTFWIYLPLMMYVLLLFVFSINNSLTLKQKTFCMISYLTLHLSYGCGFLLGVFKKKYF